MTDWLFDCVDFGVDDRIIQLPTVAMDGVSFVKTTETKIDTINFSRTSLDTVFAFNEFRLPSSELLLNGFSIIYNYDIRSPRFFEQQCQTRTPIRRFRTARRQTELGEGKKFTKQLNRKKQIQN